MPFDNWVGLLGGCLGTAAGAGMVLWPERFYRDEAAMPGEAGQPPTTSQLWTLRVGGAFFLFCGLALVYTILFGPRGPVEFVGV